MSVGDYRPVPLTTYERYAEGEMVERARAFRDEVRRRRTVRHFSEQPVPGDVIDACLEAAGTAPNGANIQPWHFVVIADPAVKSRIREAAEEEEIDFYAHRAPPELLAALRHLGTDNCRRATLGLPGMWHSASSWLRTGTRQIPRSDHSRGTR